MGPLIGRSAHLELPTASNREFVSLAPNLRPGRCLHNTLGTAQYSTLLDGPRVTWGHLEHDLLYHWLAPCVAKDFCIPGCLQQYVATQSWPIRRSGTLLL